MSCKKEFEDWVCACLYGPSELTILTTLAAGDYVAVFQNHTADKYTAPAVADADGNLVIQLEDLPEGYINRYAGAIVMELFTDETLCDKVDIPVRATYDRIWIDIKGGNSGKMTIGCQ